MRGPCAKRRVMCRITTLAGETFVGENDCANPQPACPRAEGEGYEKCKSVCGQAGHAETEALAKARTAGADARGAVAELYGHYWICEPCGAALRDAGVTCITIEFAK
jgi:deoxycytidylate deaminase